jgi:hypothetical protein
MTTPRRARSPCSSSLRRASTASAKRGHMSPASRFHDPSLPTRWARIDERRLNPFAHRGGMEH